MARLDFTRDELEQLLPYMMSKQTYGELPEGEIVQRGTIIAATDLAKEQSPELGGAEILILGYDGEGTLCGTSFQRTHSSYLKLACWTLDNLRDDMRAGFWGRKGFWNGGFIDYFQSVNE